MMFIARRVEVPFPARAAPSGGRFLPVAIHKLLLVDAD